MNAPIPIQPRLAVQGKGRTYTGTYAIGEVDIR